jgi:hypothetical protein
MRTSQFAPCPTSGQSTEDIEDQEKDYVCLNLLN